MVADCDVLIRTIKNLYWIKLEREELAAKKEQLHLKQMNLGLSRKDFTDVTFVVWDANDIIDVTDVVWDTSDIKF
jgi:exoribonuclease II